MLSLAIIASAGAGVAYAQSPAQRLEAKTDTVSARIYFRCASSVLDTAFRGNGQSLSRLRQALTTADSTRIEAVTVSAAASPEGKAGFNRRLSDARAKAAADAVVKLTGVSPEMLRIISEGEDWDGLRERVNSYNSANYPPQLRPDSVGLTANAPAAGLFDAAGLAERKAQLRSVGNKALRDYIRRTVLPDLRVSDIEVIFSRFVPSLPEPDSIIPAPEPEFIPAPEPEPAPEVVPEPAPLPTDTVVPAPAPVVAPQLAGRQAFQLLVATNLAGDVLAVPNLSVEVALRRGWSLRADGMYAWWSKPARGHYWRLQQGALTVRKYFGDERAFAGHHVGVFGQILRYDFCRGGNGVLSGGSDTPFRVNPSWGAGVEYGYTFTLRPRLRLDLTLGAGYLGGIYMKYRNDNGVSYWKSTHRRHWFGPTRAEVTLGWVISRISKEKGADR